MRKDGNGCLDEDERGLKRVDFDSEFSRIFIDAIKGIFHINFTTNYVHHRQRNSKLEKIE